MRIDGVQQVRRWNGAIASLLLSIVAGAAGASTVTYQYDASGRLTSVSRNDGMTITYTLDAAGNRQSVTMVAGSGVSGRNEYRVPEAVHYVVVHVERPSPPGEKATLKYSTVAGTALPGRDFDAVSGSFTYNV